MARLRWYESTKSGDWHWIDTRASVFLDEHYDKINVESSTDITKKFL